MVLIPHVWRGTLDGESHGYHGHKSFPFGNTSQHQETLIKALATPISWDFSRTYYIRGDQPGEEEDTQWSTT